MAVTTQSFGAAFRRLAGVALVMAAVLAVMEPTGIARHAQAGSDTALTTGSVSGLPVPRFVSLKSDRVNVRAGPTKDQDVRWVYTRAGMPVEITAEFENWRRIRDWEGAEGWVYHSLLSGKRSAVVVPTLKGDLVPLYEQRGYGIPRKLPACNPACSASSNPATAVGANSPARISTAGSARTGCGAPIRTRRWTSPAHSRGGSSHPLESAFRTRKDEACPAQWPGHDGSNSGICELAQLFRFSRTTTSTRSIS